MSASPRRLTGSTLVLATHNPGKVREIQELLGPFGLDVVSAGALGLPEPEETGDSFEAHAALKALAAPRAAGEPAPDDDSWFCLAVLGSKAGLPSATSAGPSRAIGRR